MAKALVRKHDELAKKFLTNVEVARDFLKCHLKPEIQNKLNLATLSIESESFIENDLRKRFADVIYQVNFKESSKVAYIYVLIEHQSTPDPLMPLRTLRYKLAVMQRYVDKHYKKGDHDIELPLVVSMVLYNGKDSPYPYKTDIMDMFSDKELAETVGLGKFKLIDLTTTDDNQILQHGKVALLEILQKHIRIRDFSNAIELIMSAILVAHDDNISKDLFESALSYMANAREIEDLEPLFKKILEISDYRETVMTYAEHYTQKGRQEGKQETQMEIAKQLLKSGVDSSIIASATHLSKSQIDALKETLH
jgi:predicted transposase/invertase (TIGR01784 family)